jgi:hypothetical protein
MAYRGGNIDFTVKGDKTWNLDEHDFKVLVYPNNHPDRAVAVSKADMRKVEANMYEGAVSYKDTKNLMLGYYTIEILVIEAEDSRSVFARENAFELLDSASKNVE